MRDFIKSQEGSILPMFAVVVTILIMVMAVAIDFSRYTLASEKLQTAADSAANAAAMSAKRYVRLRIDPGHYMTEGEYGPTCKSCGDPFEVTGPEDDLIDNDGWRRYECSCKDGSVKLLDRWVEYEGNGAEARTAAQAFFDINKPREMDASTGGGSGITSINIGNPGSSIYPSVVVHVQGKIKTLMMNFIDKMYPGADLSELGASRCAQGGTFYYDLDGKLNRAAPEGCN